MVAWNLILTLIEMKGTIVNVKNAIPPMWGWGVETEGVLKPRESSHWFLPSENTVGKNPNLSTRNNEFLYYSTLFF